ncbi:MAG TPA: hypothetical protein VIY73_07345 [Polyangiaceae bacterium]
MSAGAEASAGAQRSTPRFAAGEVCRTGLTSCGPHCVDLTTDTNDCGGCGTQCAAGESCVDGACTYAPCACNEVMCGSSCCGPTDQFQCVNGACQPM